MEEPMQMDAYVGVKQTDIKKATLRNNTIVVRIRQWVLNISQLNTLPSFSIKKLSWTLW